MSLSRCRFLSYLPIIIKTAGPPKFSNTLTVSPASIRTSVVRLSISAKFSSAKPLATREDVQAAEKDKNILMIDVREPSELKETGIIPGSINIPLGEVGNVLSNVSSEDFKRMYKREKPNPDFPIIFFCMKGIRSEKAQDIANKLGYKNVRNYLGSWLDWEKNVLKKAN